MVKIAVLGATGFLGGHAVRRFLSDGHKVRCVVRNKQKLTLPADVEVVRGDVTDATSLRAALAGVDGIFLALNGGSDPVRAGQVEKRGVANIAAAAHHTGVVRVVLLSGMFAQREYADYPWEQAKVQGEQLLMASPVASTVFRVGFVNETLEKFVRNGRAVLIGKQPHPVRPIAVGDIMSAAARSIEMPQTANRVYDIAGSHAMTLRQALAHYASATTGTTVTPSMVPVMPLAVMRAVNRVFLKGEMTRPLGILTSLNRYGDVTDTASWFHDFGTPPTPFAEWIKRQRIAHSTGQAQ